MSSSWRQVQIGGGVVSHVDGRWRFGLPAVAAGAGYTDAQIDDVQGRRRAAYRWCQGSRLRLEARFSHGSDQLRGTAGFGFWNAPFGDPTVPWPTLPQATWFFFASSPSDLPLAETGAGRGWFVATVNAVGWPALRLAPIALPLLLAHQVGAWRRRLWPVLRKELGISFRPVPVDITAWHRYELAWSLSGCRFRVDDELVHETAHSPRGPLAFVTWLDNQYLVLTPRGRFAAGVLALPEPQWMDVRGIDLQAG